MKSTHLIIAILITFVAIGDMLCARYPDGHFGGCWIPDKDQAANVMVIPSQTSRLKILAVPLVIDRVNTPVRIDPVNSPAAR